MSQAPESDDPPDPGPAPDWEAVTAFVEWDQTLRAGTRLRDYEIRSVIGESAFGIVYLAWDHALRRRVAVKEYLPRILAARSHAAPTIELKKNASAAAFNVGLKGFVAEARMLARFDHPALVKVYRFWEENGTAYRVMPLCEGPTLEQVLAERVQEEAEVRTWLRPVLDAVSVMHAARCFHHHIVPANILLTPGGPVLLDFAAARRLVGSMIEGPAAVATAGYTPIEQYSVAATVAPGPWTDLYSLAAVCYRAIRGEPPPPAPERLAGDRLKPLAQGAPHCTEGYAEAIDVALALQPENRPHSDAEFRELMGGIEAPLPPISIGSPHDLMAEPFTRDEASAREVTVPIPTQPYPALLAEELHPMDAPFIATPPPAPAPLPFEREKAGLSRKLMIAIGAGVCVLGAVAGLVLHLYAGRAPADAATEAAPAASAAAGSASMSEPVEAAPLPSMPVVPAAVPARPAASSAALPLRPAALPAAVPVSPTTLPATQPAGPAAPAAAKPEVPPPAVAVVRRIPVESPPASEADRRTRCADLLQEATLRQLSVAEAAFFKKECR